MENKAPDCPERVRISEFKVVRAPAALRISGLGSCVALALYDAQRKVGGLAHILLPGPAPRPRDKEQGQAGRFKFKYTDHAIHALLEEMEKAGCKRGDIVAKVAGGANMFTGPGGDVDFSPMKSAVGERNVESVRELLGALELPIVGEDVGGRTGRNVVFDAGDGRFAITSLRGEERVL